MTEAQRAKREYNQRYYYEHHAEILAQKLSIYVPRNNRRSGLDKEKSRIRVKAWRESKREHVRRVNQAWYRRIKADPVAWAAKLAKDRVYREANRERQNARCRAWVKANPERRRLKFKRSKARRRGAAGHFTRQQWQARLTYYGNCCAYCGVSLAKPTIDHIIPVVDGGSNWASNLVPACSTCNCRKRDQRWIPRPVWQMKESQ